MHFMKSHWSRACVSLFSVLPRASHIQRLPSAGPVRQPEGRLEKSRHDRCEPSHGCVEAGGKGNEYFNDFCWLLLPSFCCIFVSWLFMLLWSLVFMRFQPHLRKFRVSRGVWNYFMALQVRWRSLERVPYLKRSNAVLLSNEFALCPALVAPSVAFDRERLAAAPIGTRTKGQSPGTTCTIFLCRFCMKLKGIIHILAVKENVSL